MNNLISQVQKIGMSDKSAKVYLAALELGDSTIQQLANKSGIKRTTLYYLLDELLQFGALKQTVRRKKTYYIAESPAGLLKRTRERISEFEDVLPQLENFQNRIHKKPRTYFLFGAIGFKQAWDKIFESKSRTYSIITEGENFLDFVKEKYIINEIIQTKKALGFQSRQIITESTYAKKIVLKDKIENRTSKIVPIYYKFPFTTVIGDDVIVFISSKFDNSIMIVENMDLVKTFKNMFDLIWKSN
jgi:HTH-type transcriptional regulator, sugar sensing transcriptional regulator